MPEFSLYQIEEDESQVVELALQQGCELVADLDYPEAEFKAFTKLEDYKYYRTKTRSFFFLSDRFSRSVVEMRQIEKEGKRVFYIFPRSGGPVILFTGGGLFDEAGTKFIRPGSISYYPTYWLGTNTKQAPADLIQVYKFLVRNLKKSSIRIKPGRRVYWLGPAATNELRQGARLVGYDNLTARQILNEPEPDP